MNLLVSAVDRATWIEAQCCASVAAALLARAEYFALLEDAMTSPARLIKALSTWRQHDTRAHAFGGLVRTTSRTGG